MNAIALICGTSMRFAAGVVTICILAGFLAEFPARAQTATSITLNLSGSYVLGSVENQYMGSGVIDPLGNASFTATETFNPSDTIAFTFTLADGDSFQATSGTPTANGTTCTINATITGGTGAFSGATGSLALNYACSPNAPSAGPIQLSGSGSITITGTGLVVVEPQALTFSFLQGSAAASLATNLTNGTTQQVVYSTSTSGASWLSVSPASSTVPPFGVAPVTITVNPAGLAPGTYIGTVVVAISGGRPCPITVTVTVNPVQQALLISQTSLRFQAAAGAGPPPSQSIVVLNQGSGALNWSATASTLSGSWLSVTPNSGSAGTSATVSVDPTGLQPGDYYGLVQFSAQGAANSPQSAVVVLNVLPAGNLVLTAQPTGLIFVSQQGAPAAPAQAVVVANSSTQSAGVSTTPVSQQNGLLSTDQSSAGIVTGQQAQFLVSSNPAGLLAGTYPGTLELQFSDGSLQQVAIVVLVTPPSSAADRSQDGHKRSAAAPFCIPTQLLVVSTALGPSFNAFASWPVPLEMQIIDDCSNPLVNGTVVATFSSGDPPLQLASLGGGAWSATWQPGIQAASTPATITVQAHSLQPALSGTVQISGMLQPNATAPAIFSGGIVSAASFASSAPLAPGAFASIFGKHLGNSSVLASALPLPTDLAGAQAVVAGELAPVDYASDGQLNVLLPFDLPANSTQQIIVQQGTAYSLPQPLTIAATGPAVFTRDQSGHGPGAIVVVKPDGTQFPADATHPASTGDSLVIYCAGLGTVDPAVAIGAAAPTLPLAKVATPITATIGGQPAPVSFAGLTPTYAGLYQVNVTVPPGITPGPSVPVVLTGAGLSSPPVTVAIQ